MHALSEEFALALWQIAAVEARRGTLDALTRRGWAAKEYQDRSGCKTEVWRLTPAGAAVLLELANR